jgi:hypothetical protein
MTLVKCIEELARENIGDENRWYDWEINEAKVPVGVVLKDGSPYERNVQLKRQLNQKWKHGNSEERREIIKYYISDWGGIRTNSEQKIALYSSGDPEALISLGKAGVASWSKALCIYSPEDYAIFDARVSASLNALQIINNTKQKTFFPCLPSRNKTIAKANSLFQRKFKKENWDLAKDREYYQTYVQLLKIAKADLLDKTIEIYTLEMLLFAFAEKLITKAFPNINI